MTSTLTKPARQPRQLALTHEQWEEATDRYLHGDRIIDIAEDLGCVASTLESRIARAGLPKMKLERLKDNRGSRTKEKIAAITEEAVDQLGQNTPKSTEKLNQHADTLQKLTKVGSIIYGWGETGNIAIVVANDLGGRAETSEDEAIDIEEVATNSQQ